MAVAAVSRQQGTRQGTKGGFVPIPVHVARDNDLTDGAFRTYCILKRYCFGRRSYCWPSIRTLAAERGCTEETIRRHLHELVDAGLITISKRGRHNVYHFAPEYEAGDRGEAPVPTSRPSAPVEDRPSAVSLATASLSDHHEPSPSIPQPQSHLTSHADKTQQDPTPHTDRVHTDPIPHTDEGQGVTETQRQESTSCVGEVSTRSRDRETLTVSRLTACGVSPVIARRLVARHGAPLCEQAIELLNSYRVNGASIRNPGGWLYSAITHGYLTPRDVDCQPQRHSATGESRWLQDAARAQREEETLARAQGEEVRQRRREALAERGIAPEVEDLWQRVVEELRAQGEWKPVLAAAYLRPMGERSYALQCSVGGMGGRLEGLLPAVQAALQRQTEARDCELTLLG